MLTVLLVDVCNVVMGRSIERRMSACTVCVQVLCVSCAGCYWNNNGPRRAATGLRGVDSSEWRSCHEFCLGRSQGQKSTIKLHVIVEPVEACCQHFCSGLNGGVIYFTHSG